MAIGLLVAWGLRNPVSLCYRVVMAIQARDVETKRERAAARRKAARLREIRRNTKPLRDWLELQKERGVRAPMTALVRGSGLTWAAVHRIVQGEAQPRALTAKALERATGGEVSAVALLGLAEGPATA